MQPLAAPLLSYAIHLVGYVVVGVLPLFGLEYLVERVHRRNRTSEPGARYVDKEKPD